MLYTSCGGQRRLRVHNMAVSCCSQLADLYRNCETDTIINYFSKYGEGPAPSCLHPGGLPAQACVSVVCRSVPWRPQQPHQGRAGHPGQPVCSDPGLLQEELCESVFCWSGTEVVPAVSRSPPRSPHLSPLSPPSQLILPECMKLLPVYLNCVLKSDVLLPGADVSLDDRAYLRQLVSCMDVSESHVFFYPQLLPVVRRRVQPRGGGVGVGDGGGAFWEFLKF